MPRLEKSSWRSSLSNCLPGAENMYWGRAVCWLGWRSGKRSVKGTWRDQDQGSLGVVVVGGLEHGLTDGRMSGSGYPRLKAFWQKPPRVSLSSSPPLMPLYRGIWGELDTATLGSFSRWMWKLSSTTELLGPPFCSGWEAQKVMLKDCFISSPHSLLVLSLTSVGKCVPNLKKKQTAFFFILKQFWRKKGC